MARQKVQMDVVMVVHNRKEMAFEAISVLLGCPLICQVVVVDNASSDNIRVEGPAGLPEVKWVLLDKNEGCTAWNKGMMETVSPYALILDDDCIPDITSLYAAISKMEENASVGLAVFNIINQFTGRSEWEALEKTDSTVGWANAIGACLLVRVSSFLKVGGYKDFFLCFNDLELVLSLWEAGFQVVYDEQWKAIHKQRINGAKKRRIYFEVRNLLWTVWGHLNIVPCFLISIKFVLGALYDAKPIVEYGSVIKASKKGLMLGLRQRRRRKGGIHEDALRMFYRNFFVGARLPKGILKMCRFISRSKFVTAILYDRN